MTNHPPASTDAPRPSDPTVAPAAVWSALRAEIEAAATAYVVRFPPGAVATEAARQAIRDYLVFAEQHFVGRVAQAVSQALEARDRAVVLFDVDETLATTDPVGGTVFRPAALPLLRHLRTHPRVRGTGLLTNRPDLHLQLQHPDALRPIQPWIDAERAFSSRDILSRVPGGYAHAASFLPSVSDIIRPDRSGAIVETGTLFSLRDREKLVALRRALAVMRADGSDDAVVVVDDLRYPDYLDPGAGLFGVALQDHAAFLPWWVV